MTPYALLLVKPTDEDAVIRHRFHILAKSEHPDRPGADGVPGTMWYVLKAAYEAVETQERRDNWARRQAHLSGLCTACRGCGVTWRRVGVAARQGPVVCASCAGAGRV